MALALLNNFMLEKQKYALLAVFFKTKTEYRKSLNNVDLNYLVAETRVLGTRAVNVEKWVKSTRSTDTYCHLHKIRKKSQILCQKIRNY